jgi:NAD(P)-dependent dehydrogenase (short-subunit alcohol dehydrogenase family)
MSRVFITGSSTGLGLMAAELLVSQGHRVVLHARNTDRAADARRQLRPGATVVIGDLETIGAF